MSNILQQHGFTQGTDYEMQVHLAGEEGALRPDCVIYLPHQHGIIVDAKASQHIFALFRAEGTPEFEGAFKDIQKPCVNMPRRWVEKPIKKACAN